MNQDHWGKVSCETSNTRTEQHGMPARSKNRRPDVRVYVPKPKRVHERDIAQNPAEDKLLPSAGSSGFVDSNLKDDNPCNDTDVSLTKKSFLNRKQRQVKPTVEPYVPRAKRAEQVKQNDVPCGAVSVCHTAQTSTNDNEKVDSMYSTSPGSVELPERKKKHHRSKRKQPKHESLYDELKGSPADTRLPSDHHGKTDAESGQTRHHLRHNLSEKQPKVSNEAPVQITKTEHEDQQGDAGTALNATYPGQEQMMETPVNLCDDQSQANLQSSSTDAENICGDDKSGGPHNMDPSSVSFSSENSSIRLTSESQHHAHKTNSAIKKDLMPSERNYNRMENCVSNRDNMEPQNLKQHVEKNDSRCISSIEQDNLEYFKTTADKQNVEMTDVSEDLKDSISGTEHNVQAVSKDTDKTNAFVRHNASDQSAVENRIPTHPNTSLSEEDDSWDKMFDENGESLDDKMMQELTSAVGNVDIQKPQFDYCNFQPKEPDLDYTTYGHLLEIYDFPSSLLTRDLLVAFRQFQDTGFDIKWVDDNHAIGIFSSNFAARSALSLDHPLIKVRCLSEATRQTKMKVKKSFDFMQPYKQRPETVASVARNMVAGALGIRSKVTKEKREEERKKIKEAKEKKKNANQMKSDVWDGIFGRCAMDEN